MTKYKIGLLILAFLILSTLAFSCGGSSDFDHQVEEITNPYRFELAEWEFKSLTGEIGEFFTGGGKTDNATQEIINYFSNAGEIRNMEYTMNAMRIGNQSGDLNQTQNEIDELQRQNEARRSATEKALEMQVREALSEQGIYNSLDRYVKTGIGFPSVKVSLGDPPHLLVISPRDRIENIKEVELLPELGVEVMEKIENEVEKLGLSAVVEGLGGLSTYPSYVMNDADLRFTLEVIVHEWMHQYLAFTPLGFRYILDQVGIHRDYEIATINETVAGMVGQEIANIMYKRYVPDAETETQPPPDSNGFDFNEEMRGIRIAVDNYLAQGEIEKAEAFMEQKRLYLAENGYYIRKLNQAYFAFHGTYADSPTSVSPIGEELRKLREQSESLEVFLDSAVRITSREDLTRSLSEGE